MRRDFLKKLLALAVVPPVLEELKIPLGKSFVSLYIPSKKILSYSDIIAMELARVENYIPKLFDRDDVFYKMIIKE